MTTNSVYIDLSEVYVPLHVLNWQLQQLKDQGLIRGFSSPFQSTKKNIVKKYTNFKHE